MKKYIAFTLLFISLVIGLGYKTAKANPSQFLMNAASATATATSTLTFLTPGTATTTIYYDSFYGQPNSPTDKSFLIEQYTGSTTASTLLTNIEYSQGVAGVDCTVTPTLCDWYEDGGINPNFATTTKPFDVSQVNQYILTYASSSPGLGGVTNVSSPARRIFSIGTPTRYIRAIFTQKIGSGNGAVWAQFVPQRQKI